jgi:hypothetical protein
MINLSDDIAKDCFFKRCESCNITNLKQHVGSIINDFSDTSIDRYLRLIVLDMVNKMNITELFEFYICDKEAFTVAEFESKVTSYLKKKEQDDQKVRDFKILH